ncbi:MAG: hypothetical protein AAGB11_11115 [Pseudomonadota bacterium]
MSSIEIMAPVGNGAPNKDIDVSSLQIFLNYYSRNGWFDVESELPLTGKYSDEMMRQIADFRTKYDLKEIPPDRIAPTGETIRFMNKHAENVILGMPPPNVDRPAPPKDKPMPSSFVRTLWPIPVLKGYFKHIGKATNVVPPNTVIKFNLAKFESNEKEFGAMAYKFSFEGVGEVKVASSAVRGAKNQAKSTLGSGNAIVPGDGKLGRKIEAAITETIKMELESSWTTNDLRKFEEGVIKGDMKKIGGEMAAAKINMSIFEWLEVEIAISADYPCPFAVQGKFNLPYSLLLDWGGATKEEIAAAPEGKIEFAGTIHFGPSEATWKRIGKRIGREALEEVAKRAGPAVGEAFVRFASRVNIVIMAIEFVSYEIALFNYLVKQANNRGEWHAYIMLYGYAYVLTIGGWDYQIKSKAKRAPTEKGRTYQDAAIHDAKLAISRWGKAVIARGIIENVTKDPGSFGDPLEYLESYVTRADQIGELLAQWLEARPEMIERQLAIVAP